MRTAAHFIVLLLVFAAVASFFVYHHSRQWRIGYQLEQLREERGDLLARRRKLDFLIARSAQHDRLVRVARQLELELVAPDSDSSPR
jgi:cell division protein FtsL